MPVEHYSFANGAWRKSKAVYANVQGSWINMKEVWSNKAGTWVKVFTASYQFVTTITGYNFNLYNSAIASGWDGVTPLAATLTVSGNLGSTVSTLPAFDTGTLPAGSQVNLTVPTGSYLVGRGGDAGGSTGMGALVLGNWVEETDPGPLHYIYINGAYPGQNICSSAQFQIQPNTSYTLKGKIYSYGVVSGQTVFDVIWYDATGAQITISPGFSQGQTGGSTYINNGILHTQAITSPSNAAYCVCRVYSSSNTTWSNTSSNMVISNWALGGQYIVEENNSGYINGQAPLIAGRPGGVAINASAPMTIINNGVIGGGGGGGGMGGANPPAYLGGGGAGYNPGLNNGTVGSGGAGGSPYGGAGGNLGAAGAAGLATTQTIPGAVGGAAVTGSSNVTFQVFGSVQGALS
jgi:hypothetical protein